MFFIKPCTEEDFLAQMNDRGLWNDVSLVLNPNPIDHGGLHDSWELYIEVNPWQHYVARFSPDLHRWQDLLEAAHERALADDERTYLEFSRF